MVSAYCSSIRWPWVEMSCGMGHMCITMGIAEAIAITTMISAKLFAISSRLWPGLTRALFRKQLSCSAFYIWPATSSCLLGLKSEIGSCRRARGYGDFLRLGASSFLPRGHGVATGRHVVDGVSAVGVG